LSKGQVNETQRRMNEVLRKFREEYSEHLNENDKQIFDKCF